MEVDYTVATDKSFNEAVDAVVAAAPEYGFGVQHVHDMQAALAKKGYTREPIKIIEVCNPHHAVAVLERDVRIALMLPCRIVVYEQDGRVFISTMRASMIADMFPEADIAENAAEVEHGLIGIVVAAR